MNFSTHAHVGQRPGLFINAYNTAAVLYAQIHSKAGEPQIVASLGEGYPDGVITAGSDVFTSATTN